jgi:DNA-binding CsgD family transcriptional regulator
VELLDRAAEVRVLDDALVAARTGAGRIVVVRGDAGIGKTALVAGFVASLPADVVRFHGACDDLITPRPLAPFHDVARQAGGALAAALRDGATRDGFHDALLEHLARLPPPVVLVLEDLHWADEATLDAVQSLGRRIADRGVLLVLTLRSDEEAGDDGLLRALAGVASTTVEHVELTPLTPASVASLAVGTAIDPSALHRVTGGNPFYVTEVVATGRLDPSPSVEAAVLARVTRLPEATRRLLELVSVVPARVPTAMLDRLAPDWEVVLEPAERRGVIVLHDDAVAFRHELARVTVQRRLPAVTARRLHARVLAVLERTGAEAARLVHHAAAAGDVDAIVRHAPEAARRARATDSHREAVAQYQRALRHADRFEVRDQALLQLGLARSAMASDQPQVSATAARAAVEAARRTGDDTLTAEALARLSRIESWTSHVRRAAAAADEAVRLLEPAGASATLALAQAARAWVALTTWDGEETVRWARRCTATATEVGDDALRVLGDLYVRTVELSVTGDDAPLRAALAEAHRLREREVANQGYLGAITARSNRREFARADAWIDEALAHCHEYEYLGWAPYYHAVRGTIRLEQGRWREVEPELEVALARHQQTVWAVCLAATTRGRLLARTGGDGAEAELRRAWELACELGVLQLRSPVAIALTELRWLEDRLDAIPAELAEVRVEARQLGWSGLRGEVERWAARCGLEVAAAPELPRAFRLELEGRFVAAARVWEALGCPYDQAEVLGRSDDPEVVLRGLAILDELGAAPLARRTRRRLRELGVARVPAGPRPTTRDNPAALTARQLEVLGLLAEDLTNAQIADRLVVSVRTVDHHVSAILTKLGAGSRREAVALGTRLGALPVGQPR